MCVETDAADEREFLTSVATSLPSVLVDAGGDSEVRDWLRRVVDVCCKMRGYKADVLERRVIQAGALAPSESARIAGSNRDLDSTDNTDPPLAEERSAL